MRTRIKVLSILAILAFLVSLLPTLVASAVQGDITLDETAYTNSEAGDNIVTVEVADSDLNVAVALPGAYEILGPATGDTASPTDTFAVDADHDPIRTVSSVFDLHTGSAYIPAVGASGDTITVHTIRAQDPTAAEIDTSMEFAGLGGSAGIADVNKGSAAPDASLTLLATARLVVELTDDPVGDAAGASGDITIQGTTVNPATLATTAGATETLTGFTFSQDGNDRKLTTAFFTGAITISVTAMSTPTEGFNLKVFETRTIVADFTYDVLDNTDDGSDQTVNVASSSAPAGLDLTLREIDPVTGAPGPASGVFGIEVALINDDKLEAITNAISSEDLVKSVDVSAEVLDTSGVGVTDPNTYTVDFGDLTTVEIVDADGDGDVDVDDVSITFTDGDALSGPTTATVTTVVAATGAVTIDFGAPEGAPEAIDTLTISYTYANVVSELITALDAASLEADDDSDLASTWVTVTTGNLTVIGGVAWADRAIGALVGSGIILEVADGDTLTATYSDVSDSVDTDTATIDANAPVISAVSPADDEATNDTTPLISAQVTDAGEGIDVADILLCVDVAADCSAANDIDPNSVSKDGITGGFQVQFIPGALGQAAHTYEIVATDRVGNVATTGLSSVAADVLTFTVDAIDPTLNAVDAGIGLALDVDDDDGDSETDDYIEVESRTSIKLTFNEALDENSVEASDFDVVGSSAPSAVLIVSDDIRELVLAEGVLTFGAETAEPLVFVYLTVPTLAADATPDVDLSTTGIISDAAGNTITTADVTSIAADDLIPPVISIDFSASLGADEDDIVITVTSDESLSDIDVDVTNEETTLVTAVPMIEANKVWTGTFEIGDSTVYTVDVSVEDDNSNVNTDDDDFEGDTTAPRVNIAAIGEVNGEVEEGSVWIEFGFDDMGRVVASEAACDALGVALGVTSEFVDPFGATDDFCRGVGEYDDDTTYTEVTVTAATLATLDADGNVIGTPEDVLAELFPAGSATEFTLARTLTEGDYEGIHYG